MLGIPFSIRYRRGMLGIALFVAFHIVSASGGSTDETCPSLSFREFNFKPPGLKSCTKETPCDEHDGDCDNNDECKGDLHCGLKNCVWGDGDDCCYSPTDYAIHWSTRCNGIDSGCCTADSPCKENDGDCDNNDDCEGDLVCGDNNCIWGDRDDCCRKKSDPEIQKYHITEDKWAKMKEEYMKCTKTPQCDGCVNAIQDYLPLLLGANKLGENEVGESYVEQACIGAEKKYKNCRRSDYKDYLKNTFSLTDGVTLSKKNEVVTIDGTVKGVVGGKRGRNYDTYYQKLRPIELYAPKGKIVTIDVPKEMIGKLGVIVGLLKYGDQFKLEFPPTKKPVLKVASPWGGPIILQISEKNAIKGFFNITVNNALRTPIFTYGKNTNDQWNNELKNYSPNWAILRIPRQVDMLINSDRIKYVTDMEAAMARVKHTMDLLEEMMGLPPNSKPGADIWFFGFGGGGMRHGGVCNAGFSDMGAKYMKEVLETGGEGVVLHEAGHGFCYGDLPSNGGQWTASTVGSYMEYKLGKLAGYQMDEMDSPNLDTSIMYRMVAFDLYSNGKACGDASFNKKQLTTGSYDVCWKWLSWIPEKAHGWDVYAEVNKLVAKSTTSYDSKSDRMIDLYCKATKHNMLPLFSGLYNLHPSNNVRQNCEKLPKSELIGKWLDIVECVKLSMTTGEKDIKDCARMQHFPKLKGLCVLSGLCQEDEANNKQPTAMTRKFDLYGSTDKWLSKKYSSDKQYYCLKRAKDYFQDCKNNEEQSITATFFDKESNYAKEVSHTYPPLVPWKQISDRDCWSPCEKKGGPCPSFCGPDAYCCRDGYDDGCPMAAYGASPSKHTCVTDKPISEATWRQKDGADCWSKCGRKGGPCPNFCGSNGFCCRKGYGGCPFGAPEKSPKHHTCVLKQETGEK